MADDNLPTIEDDGYEELASWRIPEYEKHQRGFKWYLSVGILVLFLAGFSVFTPNFLFEAPNYLFLIIVVLSSAILILMNALAGETTCIITSEGILIGDRFYDYDEFKNFCVLFKPHENLKVLYLEFKATFKPRLQIPLQDQNPVTIRETLGSFLNEDLERTDESNIDFLSKKFKF